MGFERKLQIGLLSLRLSVFVVMFVWTLDKFINPDHAAKVFEHFYMIPGLSANSSYIIGAIQAVIILAFVTGFQKKWSYGLVLGMHFVSTASSYAKYLDPWNSLLFFAAIPMLAACWMLYSLREKDRIFSWE